MLTLVRQGAVGLRSPFRVDEGVLQQLGPLEGQVVPDPWLLRAFHSLREECGHPLQVVDRT
jgi:hypothetical protein